MGKTMTGESRYALSAALVAMRSRHSFIPNAFLPANTTRGAGHRIGRIWGPFIRNDRANTSPTLGTLSLASSLAVANMAYSSVILGTSVGSTLTLVDSRQKFYFLTSAPGATSGNGPASLVWTLNRTPYSVAGGLETPVVQESLPGAYGSPTSTRLSINVSPYPFGGAQRAAYVVALAF